MFGMLVHLRILIRMRMQIVMYNVHSIDVCTVHCTINSSRYLSNLSIYSRIYCIDWFTRIQSYMILTTICLWNMLINFAFNRSNSHIGTHRQTLLYMQYIYIYTLLLLPAIERVCVLVLSESE